MFAKCVILIVDLADSKNDLELLLGWIEYFEVSNTNVAYIAVIFILSRQSCL